MSKINAIASVVKECLKAKSKFKPFNSSHEGYAVLLEEVDELWDEIKKKDSVRSIDRMREEAIQVGAMALRFLIDICGDEFTPDATFISNEGRLCEFCKESDWSYMQNRINEAYLKGAREAWLIAKKNASVGCGVPVEWGDACDAYRAVFGEGAP